VLVRLLVLLVLVPIVELALLIQLGRWVGVWPTIGVVVGTGIGGAILARRQGLQAVRRVRDCLAAGSFPGAPLLDGALIVAGGLLLLTPGLITDAVGLALLIPVSRRWIRRALVSRLRRRLFSARSGP